MGECMENLTRGEIWIKAGGVGGGRGWESDRGSSVGTIVTAHKCHSPLRTQSTTGHSTSGH